MMLGLLLTHKETLLQFTLNRRHKMIQNFIEADLIELFSSLPVYIGDKEGGEMLFERKYDNDISLLIYFNVYEEKVEMIISKNENSIVSFFTPTDRINIMSNSVFFGFNGKRVAAVQINPSPLLLIP